jgi:hypothetical protein
MRYWEIIEGTSSGAKKAQQVWKQTQRTCQALRKLRSKQQDANDAKASARSLPVGAERSRRLNAAGRREAEARRTYGDTLSKANTKISQTMAKPATR